MRLDTPVAAGEVFEFALDDQSVKVRESGSEVSFPDRLPRGSDYEVNQTSGPRACRLSANRAGTLADEDVVVSADCGTPPVSGLRLSVVVTSELSEGESFTFTSGADSVSITAKNEPAAFSKTLATGEAYTVDQTSGPRACTLSTNRTGTAATQDIEVTADCGAPAPLVALQGTLSGPLGTQVGLRSLGQNLSVSVNPQSAGDPYSRQTFAFEPRPAGTSYSIELTATPENETCSVYRGASGTLPVTASSVKVGCEHTFDLVSRGTDDAQLATFFESWEVGIGGAANAVGATAQGYGEGRFAVFASYAAGLSGATGSYRQVFWRDRMTGETRLVSADPAGAEGNGNSAAPAISSDGLHVVFESYASNLVEGDGNGVRDVFLWNANQPSSGVVRVSVGAGDAELNADSHQPTISGDGSVVAFVTGATNLSGGDPGNGAGAVVRRDLPSKSNKLVSITQSGDAVDAAYPMLSEDADRLVFWSYSADITKNDNNGLWDVFVYQHSDGSQRRISLRENGGERGQGDDSTSRVVAPAISGNGRFVAYATTSPNVVAGDTNAEQDVFLVDLDGDLGVRRVSVAPDGSQGDGSTPANQGDRVALSYDGKWVAFNSQAKNFGAASAGNVFVRNVDSGEMRTITNFTYGTSTPSLSRTSAYVAFGGADKLDPRFDSTGQFAHFTGLSRAFFWTD